MLCLLIYVLLYQADLSLFAACFTEGSECRPCLLIEILIVGQRHAQNHFGLLLFSMKFDADGGKCFAVCIEDGGESQNVRAIICARAELSCVCAPCSFLSAAQL
jgi:hypothetical protein